MGQLYVCSVVGWSYWLHIMEARWQDTLRSLSPKLKRKRSLNETDYKRARSCSPSISQVRSCSPSRSLLSSTISSRAKQREAIRWISKRRPSQITGLSPSMQYLQNTENDEETKQMDQSTTESLPSPRYPGDAEYPLPYEYPDHSASKARRRRSALRYS